MNSLLKVWKKQVKSSSLVRILRIYWKVIFNEERRRIGRRAERLCFLKQLIKKNYRSVLYRLKFGSLLWSKKKFLILLNLLMMKSIWRL